MQKNERFFIFSWKEITVIGLLILISIGFFFTLGLHYGKQIHPEAPPAPEVAGKLEEGPETVPAKETLDEASQHAASTTQDTIKSATQEELKESGLKVDQPKAVDLPTEKTVGKKIEKKNEKALEKAPEKETEKEPAVENSSGRFAIQLGSYPSKKEAQAKIKVMNKRGLHPEVRTAQVNGQTRYRMVLPGFKTKALADQKGKDLHAKRKIENFIVIKDSVGG